MAKLVTAVRTYFKDGTYRDNVIIVEIPNKAADIIKKSWDERGVYNCVTAKFLSSNQAGICLLRKDEEHISIIRGVSQEDTHREEVFKRHFKDEEEDDE